MWGLFALVLLVLCGIWILSALSTALQTLGKWRFKQEYAHYRPLFFEKFLRKTFFSKEWEGLQCAISYGRSILLLAYTTLLFFSLLKVVDPRKFHLLLYIVSGLLVAFIIDGIIRCTATFKSKSAMKALSFFTSCILTLLFPLIWPFLKIQSSLMKRIGQREKNPTINIKEQILEMIHDTELNLYLDPQDQKLIVSMASFRERIAREIMVPRIDLFSIDATTPIIEAISPLMKEGYSRIPVFESNVDHIIGVLHYKDLFISYIKYVQDPESEKYLNLPIRSLIKPILYVPETKKISLLLQEFKQKQNHLAIVVDEYGGTEGIVTIEDILEELVGEIADEYDAKEDRLFFPIPSGGWILDARMNILDIEEELNIKIPSSPEYDTVGGYIFHEAGSIPSKGWRIDHDDFELEILSSDERSIEKVKIIPRHPLTN